MTNYRLIPASGLSRKIIHVCCLAMLTSVLLIACSKSNPDPSGNNNGNGNGTGNGNGNGSGNGNGNGNGGSGTTLTYINDTYTTI
ncbi:MAG TPA: hypothetical protein VL832_18550, partial [Puia sp.]|nr:hypothetical protein [Puia sp.]